MADAALVEEILGAELSDAAERALDVLMDRVPYTTTALFALECWVREMGDEAGAAMVGAFCREFAKHEAATL